MSAPGDAAPQFWATASVRESARPVKLSLKKYCPVRPVPDRYNRGSSNSSLGRITLLPIATARGGDAYECDHRNHQAGRLRDRRHQASRPRHVIVFAKVGSPHVVAVVTRDVRFA